MSNYIKYFKNLFYCTRCKEFKYCPRGSCESESIGLIEIQERVELNSKGRNLGLNDSKEIKQLLTDRASED